jgi:NADPH:quinone reductase-like Zn-dependent oxidoreductase
MDHTQAWVLYAGSSASASEPRRALVLEDFALPPLTPDAVRVEVLYGCWEGNMSHAVERSPIDVCRSRGEDRVVIGNAGVVRIVELGAEVSEGLAVGDTCLFFPVGATDANGFMLTIHGYDAPGTIGLLARNTVIPATNVIKLPPNSSFGLEQWAGFGVRYMTAWNNWWVAYRCFRAQLSEAEHPVLDVWGWGGGTTLAEMHLAHLHGARTVMLSGTDANLEAISSLGIDTLDRRSFPDLNYDPTRFAADRDYQELYRKSERAFLAAVAERTEDRGVSIFVDYIGSPVWRATLKALARLGVVTTAGWKHGMEMSVNRAIECIARHTHVHTHATRRTDALMAVAYAETHGWVPPPQRVQYAFEDIPKLVEDYGAGTTGYFPVFRASS